MATPLKVLTLNCWGVFTPLACQLRHERMTAIAKELSKAEYDIVLLQEIWTQSDYEKICNKVLPVMPYSHYFHSGMFGSGVCVFSKFPIVETMSHPYTVNGYAHKLAHGDWFCGKAVGLSKIMVHDVRVNVYSTHTHAEYSEEKDEYCAHRIVQAFELSQFIKNTSETCDLVIAGGDFNFKPTDLHYGVVRYNANLQDSWLTQRDASSDTSGGMTCDRPDNSFVTKQCLQRNPQGVRLDYLLYRNNTGIELKCEKCYVTMQKVPGMDFNYSDHEGVAAEFKIKRNITAMAPPREHGEVEKHLSGILPLLDAGVRKVRSDQVFYTAIFFLAIFTVVFTADWGESWTALGTLMGLLRTALTVTAATCFWLTLVMANREINGLLATRKDVNNLLRSNNAV